MTATKACAVRFELQFANHFAFHRDHVRGPNRRFPIRLSATRLNCSPMYAEKADDAALTLPISSPVSKSWAPSRVMFSGGFLPRKKSVSHSWAVFCSVDPQLTRFTLE